MAVLANYKLSDAELPRLLELWQLLESGFERFAFALRRFNLAFERDLVEDRLVDLVIAAEALFLSDTDSETRGELGYRLALRAAKFIEDQEHSQLDLYRIMRRAYNMRSSIVHAGHHGKVRLPSDSAATLSKFTDVVEGLVRCALQKALALRESGKRLRTGEYWDELVFSKMEPR